MGFNLTSSQRRIQPLNPQIGFNVNSIQKQIQLSNPQMIFKVNSDQRQIQPQTIKYDSMLIPFKVRFTH